MKGSNTHGIGRLMQYALIAFPIAFAGIPIYIFLPDYYASEYGISLGTMSLVLFIIRCFDGLIDPVIGYYSDHWVRQRHWLFPLVMLLFAIGFFTLCLPWMHSVLSNFIIGLLLTTTAFSFLSINLNAIGALWCKTEAAKNRMVSLREGIGLVGVLAASVMPVVLANFLTNQVAYRYYAMIFIILLVVAGWIFMRWMRREKMEITPVVAHKVHSNLRDYLRQLDQRLRWLFGVYTLSALGSAVPGVMLIFFSKFVLQTPTKTGIYLFAYFLGAIISVPIWQFLMKRFTKQVLWLTGILISIAVFSLAFGLPKGALWSFTAISFVSGLCFGVELIAPNILLAIWVDQTERTHLANGYYAMLAFLGKLCFALATVLCMPLLDAAGFNIQGGNTSEVLSLIRCLYTLFPCLLKLLAAFLLIYWCLSDKRGCK